MLLRTRCKLIHLQSLDIDSGKYIITRDITRLSHEWETCHLGEIIKFYNLENLTSNLKKLKP